MPRKAAKPPRRAPGTGTIRTHKGRATPYEAVPAVVVQGVKLPSMYFATKAEAEAWLRDVAARARLGLIDVRRKLPLQRFIDEQWWPAVQAAAAAGAYSPKTIQTYGAIRGRLRQLDLSRDIQSYGPDDMKQIERQLAQHLQRKSVDVALAVLSAVWNYAISEKLRQDNPVKSMRTSRLGRVVIARPTPKRPPWTPQHLHAFLRGIAGDPFEALWLLLALRYLRINEALAVVWGNWHQTIDRSFVQIEATLYMANRQTWQRRPTKSEQGARTVPSNGRINAALHDRYAATRFHAPTDLIFTTPDGYPISDAAVRGWLREWCAMLALPRMTPHAFRHLGASLMDELQVAPNVRAVALGHTEQVDKAVYTHVSDPRVTAAYALADRQLGID